MHPSGHIALWCALLLLLASVWTVPRPAHAQVSLQAGPRLMALGGGGTAVAGDLWGGSNPAAWAGLASRQLGFFAGQAFELSELRLGAVRVAQPLPWLTAVVGAQTFGFEQFREHQFPVGVAREVTLGTTRTLAVGAEARYTHVSIPGYGNDGAVGLTLGAQVQVLRTVRAGVQAVHLNAPTLGGGDELPRLLQVGLAYQPQEAFLLVLDAVKDVLFPVSYRGGVEVQPVESLTLRGGIATQPTRFTAGLGIHVGRLTADVAAERHDVLGWSPAVGLLLR